MIGVSTLLQGQSVTAVSIIDGISSDIEDGRTRQEYDQSYGFEITTSRGVTSVVFRNSSNGYYGGELRLCEDAPPDVRWAEIVQDTSF